MSVPSWFSAEQVKILEFAQGHHYGQKRKYTGEPYWHHLVSVATLVHIHTPFSGSGVTVALLHDILEDTRCTKDELLSFLMYSNDPNAPRTVELVEALTDTYTKKKFPNMNRKERKSMEAVRMRKTPLLSQTVKYADIIDNIGSITEHDPEFADVYVKEKRQLLRYMNAGHFELYLRCCYYVQKALLDLGVS